MTIGILLITHGSFGESLIQNACHVLGQRPPLLQQLGVAAQDDPNSLLPLAQQLLKLVKSDVGVLIFTDLFASTPANLAQRLLIPGSVEGLAGVNLPMLLRAINYRHLGLSETLQRAREGGRDAVLSLSPADSLPC